MTSIVEAKPYGLIKSQLKKSDTISIALCTTCPSYMDIGKKEMSQLARRLEKDGFNIVNMGVTSTACSFPILTKKQKKLEGNTIVVLGCDAHVYNLKRLFPHRKIIPALTTLGLGAIDGDGCLHIVNKHEEY
ncbi:hypothetical protein ES703_79915 [subsurface metagenome]